MKPVKLSCPRILPRKESVSVTSKQSALSDSALVKLDEH